jgi:[acyl-carrier-protein] S-malonyltransferase
MAVAFTFPGQGSQEVGMGKALAEAHGPAREVFAEVDEALGQKLSELMWKGPESELTLTENAQPALMAVSMAAMRVLERVHGLALESQVKFVAGHSLGEYSSLAAARTLTLADTARLLKTRGRAMQEATPPGVGAMAALLGLDLPDVLAIADEAAQGEVLAAANDNAAGQVVVSGHKAAVSRAIDLAKTKGARRAVLLTVSAPFHCPLMKPAADAMAEALAKVEMRKPLVPLIANVTAASATDPQVIRDQLVRQVTGLVRWRESIAAMALEGVDTFCEVGAGKVLSGLLRRNAPQAKAIAMGTPQEIEQGLRALRENAHAV